MDKNIDIRFHFIIHVFFEKNIKLIKIDDKINRSDALIKIILL